MDSGQVVDNPWIRSRYVVNRQKPRKYIVTITSVENAIVEKTFPNVIHLSPCEKVRKIRRKIENREFSIAHPRFIHQLSTKMWIQKVIDIIHNHFVDKLFLRYRKKHLTNETSFNIMKIGIL